MLHAGTIFLPAYGICGRAVKRKKGRKRGTGGERERGIGIHTQSSCLGEIARSAQERKRGKAEREERGKKGEVQAIFVRDATFV